MMWLMSVTPGPSTLCSAPNNGRANKAGGSSNSAPLCDRQRPLDSLPEGQKRPRQDSAYRYGITDRIDLHGIHEAFETDAFEADAESFLKL
jgi:hypothetical protein